jgi:hypothetical protein
MKRELQENAKTEQLRQEVLRQFQNLKQLTPDERKELLYKLSPRGLRPKPPKIEYVESANIKNLPPKLKAIFERAKQDPEFVNEIIKVLQSAVSKMLVHAQDHQSFCDIFIYSPDVAKKLMKIYGISESELKEEVAKIGFYQGHRNYSEPFFITLSIAYGIGLYIDNPTIRILSLMLIAARYWNSMVKSVFPRGCDHAYAKYAIQYLTKNNSPFKKYNTPLAFFTKYFVINLDNFLPIYIRQDVADPKNGLIKILTTIQPRIHGYFTDTFRKHYYTAYEKGLKVTSEDAYKSAYDNKNEMIEAKETIQNTIDKILDKFKKNQMLSKNVLLRQDVKSYLKQKFSISDKIIEAIDKYLSENQEDTEMLAELILQGLQPKSEDDVCQLDTEGFMKRVGNAKKNENFIKFKEYRNQITEHLFGSLKHKLGTQSWYRLQNIVGYALFIYFKALVCKKV